MTIVLVESTSAVCIFGLGFAITAFAFYKFGGNFIEGNLDEDEYEPIEKEVNTVELRKQGSSRTFRGS
ncbi:hypothetical protein [Bacillus paranthracis]|uniref:hypothetical protein n=1 Tax=Bacillus paranthracis TaxID=2026186 RepID=UPI002D7905EC|nr:hypothetical protein [Bacillus paranthracis]